jgi:selenide,water dikinase
VREASVSAKPSSRSIRAIASPMPDEPPVTSADAHGSTISEREESGTDGEPEPIPGSSSPLSATAAPRPPSRIVRRESSVAQLTGLPVGGGCAAKYPAARLEELLRGFVPAESENLLVGLSSADDAAVYRLDDERALVFTVDFFPPLVDDPVDFGAIAATNALNDVFAMGGTPLLALSIAAFPEELPVETLGAILAGAEEQVRAAGALLAGGHTIRDTEPKYGLAVVGTVHPDAIWTKSDARPGDALLLTKPLGTGLVSSGARGAAADERSRRVALMRRSTATRPRRCGRSSRTPSPT